MAITERRQVVANEQELASAREKFNKSRMSKGNCTFDQLLELYVNPNLSFRDIGRKDGVVRQVAQVKYLKFFQPLLDGISFDDAHKQRLTEARLERRGPVVDAISLVPAHILRVASLARAHGFAVEHAYAAESRGWPTRLLDLRIGGKRTLVLIAQKSLTITSKLYASFWVKESTIKIMQRIVICVWIDGFSRQYYVFRSQDLHGRARGKDRVLYMYLPLGSRVRRPREGQINWAIHKSAWHLFRDC